MSVFSIRTVLFDAGGQPFQLRALAELQQFGAHGDASGIVAPGRYATDARVVGDSRTRTLHHRREAA